MPVVIFWGTIGIYNFIRVYIVPFDFDQIYNAMSMLAYVQNNGSLCRCSKTFIYNNIFEIRSQ